MVRRNVYNESIYLFIGGNFWYTITWFSEMSKKKRNLNKFAGTQRLRDKNWC